LEPEVWGRIIVEKLQTGDRLSGVRTSLRPPAGAGSFQEKRGDQITLRPKFFDVKLAESRNQHMYSDRRKLGRTVVHQRAKLLLPNFDSPQDCVVRDLSTMGACIEFDANRIGRVDKKFELSFDNFVTGWSCHVIWQFRGLVGVSWTCAFLEEKRLTG
jgi:hypothetical protein